MQLLATFLSKTMLGPESTVAPRRVADKTKAAATPGAVM